MLSSKIYRRIRQSPSLKRKPTHSAASEERASTRRSAIDFQSIHRKFDATSKMLLIESEWRYSPPSSIRASWTFPRRTRFLFDVKLAFANAKERTRFFQFRSPECKVWVQNQNVVLKKSTHKALFNFFKPRLIGVVKPAIAKAAEIQIRPSFDQLDEQSSPI